MKDTIGQISLIRQPKKRPEKDRRTQSKSFYSHASGHNLKPHMYSYGNVKVSSSDIGIGYSEENPENISNYDKSMTSYGNNETNNPGAFDDIKKDQKDLSVFLSSNNLEIFKKENTFKSNGIYDVTRRNIFVTNQKKEKNEFIKCSVGVFQSYLEKSSLIVSSKYENYDSKDSFKDEQYSNTEEVFYVNNKNYYNSGNIKPFTETSPVTYNSIYETENAKNEYYQSNQSYANHGFIYKSKKPDSIAFGGLKR